MNKDLYAKVKASARFCRDQEARKKVHLFLDVIRTGRVGEVLKRYGVPRSSYFRWWARYRDSEFKMESLLLRSRRPKSCPGKVGEKIVRKIKKYRFQFHYGPKRIAFFLGLYHKIQVSESTVRRVILRKGWLLRRYRTKKINPHRKRYELPIPGHLQVDIKYVPEKIQGEQCYVYNAIDDCSRWRYAKAYAGKSSASAVDFAKNLIKAAPFLILSVQTDNDVAFTNRFTRHHMFSQHLFDIVLEQEGIEHRLIPPGVKELNGKVERSHRTDEDEFFWKCSYESLETFQTSLTQWIYAYNYYRPHSSLGGKTPMEKLIEKTILPLLALKRIYKERKSVETRLQPRYIRTLVTYLKYLDWIQSDPFHCSDVLNYYKRRAKIVWGNPSFINPGIPDCFFAFEKAWFSSINHP